MTSLWAATIEIVYVVGVICAIWCVWDLFTGKNIGLVWKIVLGILLLFTSWIGLILYYFIIRDRMPDK